ncbi:Phospholipase A1 [Thalassocella blandensis]|nr:Phospholipase A1 [Thalassocella blandensis]
MLKPFCIQSSFCKTFHTVALVALVVCSLPWCANAENSQADQTSAYQRCLQEKIETASEATTVAIVKQACSIEEEKVTIDGQAREFGAISSRIFQERMQEFDPYVIIPHRMNYVLPLYMTNHINTEPYESYGEKSDHLEDTEAKFQLSLKIPLNSHGMLVEGDGLYFAFTVKSWWQVYASNISKPFRETNYRPELFYLRPLAWQPVGGNAGFAVGIEHESNGRPEEFSRSWNRIYSLLLVEKGNLALTFKPWWRIPEHEDKYLGDPTGDDNPDIEDYMGHFEMNAAYKWQHFEVNFMGRQNFRTLRGAFEAGFIFPLSGRLRGYMTLFNGYGESMIDYNVSQTRFGLGIALTGFL